MKNKNVLGILIMLFFGLKLAAAPVFNDPVTLTQPNGSIINCFISGDEYYNYYHDKEGFTIVIGEDGYYYYGRSIGTDVIATPYKVGSINPASVGLKPHEIISSEKYQELKNELYSPMPERSKTKNPSTGKFSNITIFVTFKDLADWTTTSINGINSKLNGPKESMKNFYYQSSYGKSDMRSYLFPDPSVRTCYKDTNPVGYYKPYSSSNKIGYTDAADRKFREQILVKSAVEYVNANSPVPDSINVDQDDDGLIDNVMIFVNTSENIQGNLLWAHRWTLTTTSASIHEKSVFSYHIIPINKADVYTMSHEMFHTFGAPDLYTGGTYSGMMPVGAWDIMANHYCELGAYLRHKYTQKTWIPVMPEITDPGQYKLKSVTSKDSNCFVIKSPVSEYEFFVLEYRKRVPGTYDTTLLGEGLLIYRIDTMFYGNNSFDSSKIWNEIFIYRPGPITNNMVTESMNNLKAPFGIEGRTKFNSKNMSSTQPLCLLTYGDRGGIDISDITISGNYVTFFFNGFDITPQLKAIDTIYLDAKRNSGYTIAMNTNLSTWLSSSTEDWLRITQNNFITKKIDVRAFTENTGYTRRGYVSISVGGKEMKNIVVIQNGPLGPNPNGVNKEVVNFETNIHPNPVADILYVNAPYPIERITIFDARGVEVLTQSINNSSAEINCANLLSGTYTVHLITERGNERHKMIKK